jgi:signal transduction histidine kinase
LSQRPENDLTPIESEGAPRELWPLINATNQVMARLAHLLEHQRRFVRDTSHQLRTPLAVLKVQVQSALRGDQAPEVALNEIEHTVDRATRMANQIGIFAADEYTRRDPAYWSTYRQRIGSVTAVEVQRVARQHLIPEKLILLVVGNQADIDKGDGKGGPPLAALAPGAKVENLPLRDPMTMKRN